MHSPQRKALYRAQQDQANAIVKGLPLQEYNSAVHLAEIAILPDRNDRFIKEVYELADMVMPVTLSAELLARITSAGQHDLNNILTGAEFEKSRGMVEGLFDVDLGEVRWFPLETSLREYVEGTCYPVGDSAHYITTQHADGGVLSTDLLVHEMGHAADFTLSRLENDDNLLVRHISLAETFAYYCQYRYLAEHGSPLLRRGSTGGFIYTYFCIATLRYCSKNDISLEEMDADTALDDEEFSALLKSYKTRGIDGRKFLSGVLKERVKSYGNLEAMIFWEISSRIGIVFSILLLDRPPEVLKSLSRDNSLNTGLKSLVDKYLPDYYDEISNLEVKINKYIDGK